MLLGIEVGGTKLQLGVGRGDGKLLALERFEVRPNLGAEGILWQIEAAAPALIARHDVRAIGIGFGGPVDAARGVVVKSHHVDGWEHHRLVEWCAQKLSRPARLQNDCDAAALAEARFGAGRGAKVVLFVTVGTGIGGGLVVDGRLYQGSGHGAAEIGHMRPGLHAERADQTVEALASGWGIAAAARERLAELKSHGQSQNAQEAQAAGDLSARCAGNLDALTAQTVAAAAGEGNPIARDVLAQACRALGWAIAQAITLVSPEVVVIGGGVSQMGESLFLDPVRREVARFVFPPLADKYRIVPAGLGEQVVVHGALAVAADAFVG